MLSKELRLVASLQQVACHGAAHVAQADKAQAGMPHAMPRKHPLEAPHGKRKPRESYEKS